MNQEIKQKWVSALREYRMPNGNEPRDLYHVSLMSINGQLSPDGILCDIYLKEKGLQWDGNKCLGCSHSIPKEVKQWAEIDRFDPILQTYTKDGKYIPIKNYELKTLNLISAIGGVYIENATRAIKYKDIADLIEADL